MGNSLVWLPKPFGGLSERISKQLRSFKHTPRAERRAGIFLESEKVKVRITGRKSGELNRQSEVDIIYQPDKVAEHPTVRAIKTALEKRGYKVEIEIVK